MDRDASSARAACVVEVRSLGLTVDFQAAEELCTEISAKFTRERIQLDLGACGLVERGWYTDVRERFALVLCQGTSEGRPMMSDLPGSKREWRERLTPMQYRVLRRVGTEPPFTGTYNDCHEPGTYRCAGCRTVLLNADDKLDSNTGWPSFTAPADEGSVELRKEGLVLRRTEVRCATCNGHLGHVFGDGPADRGGQRFCINSAALELDRGRQL